VDESGNTGDLARPGKTIDFGGQQVFALACVGVSNPEPLNEELDRLRRVHQVQATELKSSALKAKPSLVCDLAGYLHDQALPFFVEVVDKRFMIAANMINCLVMPTVGTCDLTLEAQWFRNILAEFLHSGAPSAVISTYVAACDAPSAASVTAAFHVLIDWLETIGGPDDVGRALEFLTRDSLSDFVKAGPDDPLVHARYLPPPDLGTKGQSIWMLPNLTSLTNIYARINRYRRRRLAEVTIIHDEQAHFEAILTDAKSLAERLAAEGGAVPARFADYHFTEQARLVFGCSMETPGIQAADVIAGFVMRHVKTVLHDGRPPTQAAARTFSTLVDLTDPLRGLGINFVLSSADVMRLGIQPI
jgi:hypothetical protein